MDSTLPIVDLRSDLAYRQGHRIGASHLPFADLIMRRHELPLPGVALQIVHDDQDSLQAAAELLQSWGYPIAATKLIDKEALSQWQQAGLIVVGVASRQLWKANASLERVLDSSDLWPLRSNSLRVPQALDLACGSGRDALRLARAGFQVLAVDHKRDALERLQCSATALHLSIIYRCTDIEVPEFVLPENAFDLISVARYLHRPLLPAIGRWLAPGGVLVYETFARGAERFSGPKRAEYLLEPGELAAQFALWQVLHDQIVHLPDGRPVQQFVARRPATGGMAVS